MCLQNFAWVCLVSVPKIQVKNLERFVCTSRANGFWSLENRCHIVMREFLSGQRASFVRHFIDRISYNFFCRQHPTSNSRLSLRQRFAFWMATYNCALCISTLQPVRSDCRRLGRALLIQQAGDGGENRNGSHQSRSLSIRRCQMCQMETDGVPTSISTTWITLWPTWLILSIMSSSSHNDPSTLSSAEPILDQAQYNFGRCSYFLSLVIIRVDYIFKRRFLRNRKRNWGFKIDSVANNSLRLWVWRESLFTLNHPRTIALWDRSNRQL